MRYLLVFLLLTLTPLAASAQQSADIPADPKGVQVVDRALVELDDGAYFYAVLYNQGDQSRLDVYKGLPWKKIHHWNIEFQGSKVKVSPNAVLQAMAEGQQIVFYWREFVGYREGAVHINLVYDRTTGKFSTSWTD